VGLLLISGLLMDDSDGNDIETGLHCAETGGSESQV
jgi:hypothetical protein